MTIVAGEGSCCAKVSRALSMSAKCTKLSEYKLFKWKNRFYRMQNNLLKHAHLKEQRLLKESTMLHPRESEARVQSN